MDKMFLSSWALKLLFVLLISFHSLKLSAQVEGCTDPYALNYNPEATWNDGSCIYEESYFFPEQFLELPDELEENSGLIFWADGIWTFNDSGGDPKIYKVDTAGSTIVQEITLSNASNVDWEDITHDADYFYIGDFGNNNGNRKDLKIYKIAKSDIPSSGNAEVSAGIIEFNYADQDDFSVNPENNEYDCEAMICVDGELYLFTKNWVSETSRLYSMSNQVGSYSIWPLDTLESNGLVTGASWSEELEQVILSGYKIYTPFLFLLFDYHDHNFLSGNKRQIMMPGIFGAQTEGICFVQGYDAFLSCEKSLFTQKVFSFSTALWTDTTMIGVEEPMNRLAIAIYPNPVTDGHFSITIPDPVKDTYLIKLYNSSGKVVHDKQITVQAGQKTHSMMIDIPGFIPGIYIMQILSGDMVARESIIVQ